MALQTSGAISIGDIATEFGGTAPHSLSEYYGAADGVPASGAISIKGFYGKANIFTFTISSTQTNANLASLATSAGWDGSAPVEATIANGVTINGSNTHALYVNTAFSGGVTVINNGTIVAKGGNGANASTNSTGATGGSGFAGIYHDMAITVENNGTIAGGGGGGGSGGAYRWGNWANGCGGGGGGGRTSNTNTSGGSYGGANGLLASSGNAGSGGSYNSAGSGGNGSRADDGTSGMQSGSGGSGGTWGAGGGAGNASYTFKGNPNGGTNRAGGAGGSAGACTTGSGGITFTVNGSRYGAVS